MREKGSYLKKWTGRLPVALVYPNAYEVGMSSLGFQLVYALLNEEEALVCERFFLPAPGEKLRSVESGRALADFPLVFFSVSFEQDYPNLVRVLLDASLPPLAADRQPRIAPGQPLIVGGGVAVFMNPEPIAPFMDLCVIGEAEAVVPDLLGLLRASIATVVRRDILSAAAKTVPGCYAPGFYAPEYDGAFCGYRVEPGIPERVRKVVASSCTTAAHSQLLTPEAEFSDLFLTELGRGCSRGCRFCAAGFIYRPPRLWDGAAVIRGLAERPSGTERIGLLGMEMVDRDALADIARYLQGSGCSLSFSSLRVDRISEPLLQLLAGSHLKSVAIAPDGASERLRRVINKGLAEEDLLSAAERLVAVGLGKLKLYLMIGLPTETQDDLQEMVDCIRRLKARVTAIGRGRGRLCEITLSVNSFIPKPWTPFQFHPFGISERLEPGETRSETEALHQLKKKIIFLRKSLAGESNVHFRCDKPEKVFFQAVLSRGDRRLAPVLLAMAEQGMGWRQAMQRAGLRGEGYAVCGHGERTIFPWDVLDHGINRGFLWREYLRSFRGEATRPCERGDCRLCGVCSEG